MTHEHSAGGEAHDGPEHDDSLPDADTVPVAEDPGELDPVEWPDEWEESPMAAPRPEPVEDWRRDDRSL